MAEKPDRTAIVPAGPERRRLLRELLVLDDWTPGQLVRYAELITLEYASVMRTHVDDVVLAEHRAKGGDKVFSQEVVNALVGEFGSFGDLQRSTQPCS